MGLVVTLLEWEQVGGAEHLARMWDKRRPGRSDPTVSS
jgi:hypothetical protein